MLRRHALRAASLIALSLFAGCHSLSRLRLTETVQDSEGRRADLWIWIDAPGPVLSSPERPVADAVVGLVLYPFDVILSTWLALRAPFDPEFDIQWGSVGAIAGIALPWVTLMPYVYPPVDRSDQAGPVLAPPAFDELLSRARAGDGIEAYHALVGPYRWHDELLHAIVPATGPPPDDAK